VWPRIAGHFFTLISALVPDQIAGARRIIMLDRYPQRNSHPHSGIAIVIGLCCFFFAASATLAAVPGFKIKVPRKTTAPNLPITKLRTLISVDSEAAVTFKITSPAGVVFTYAPLSSGDPSQAHLFATSGLPSDLVSLFPLSMNAVGVAPPAGDPARKKYVFLFNLNSDFDGTCANTMATATETWQIEVTAGPQITGTCAQSLDSNVTGSICSGTALRTIPLTEDVATITKLDDTAMPTSLLACRPGVDAVLVLDRSGSMASAVLGGSGTPKIDALHGAVTSFINVWNILRTNETMNTPGGPALSASPADAVGVVYFDSNASWLSELNAPVVAGVSSVIDGLKTYDAAISTDVTTNVPLVGANTATSIGGGLLKAANAFTGRPPDNRKVILLMTDGFQNTDPLAQVMGSNIQTTVGGGAGANLPNQPPTQIYTVGVGTDTAVNPIILQAIANASGGFYMNTQTDATVLPTYFLELLQNFVKFSTVETLRIAAGNTTPTSPSVTTVPVTTTTQSITFHVDFDPRGGPLRAIVQPPAGAAAITEVSSTGTLIVNRMLPLEGFGTSGGDWTIRLESATGRGTSFNLIVLADDIGLNSDMISIASDYGTTDKIKVVARVNESEVPILGLGGNPNDKIVVKLVGPGTSLGDLLSTSQASSTPPTSPDRIAPVQAKLDNILKSDPNALQIKDLSQFQLLDNGNPNNGDAKAGDGVYSALIPPQLEGQYNLIFGIEGKSKGVGRFSRMQLRTVNIRAIPVASTSQTQATLQRDKVLVINFTPRTAGGQFLGPGWANYIWFTSPSTTPVKPVDNFNGTYTASIPFTGDLPRVTIHFIRDAVMITDDVTPDKLPVPLNNGNVVIPKVDTSGIIVNGVGGFKRWGLSLHAGVSIPHGDLNTIFNPGPNAGVDLEYRFNQMFSAEAIYTYHRFNGENFGFGTIPDLNVHQLSLNGKVYGSTSPVRPFFNFGGGAYVFTPGASTHGGLNVGGGVQFDVTPNFAIDGMYNFHNVFTSGSNTKFSAVQGGVRFRF
jgi:Outer membrane protein beta-barrel domain/von Willebrand factor type A domain